MNNTTIQSQRQAQRMNDDEIDLLEVFWTLVHGWKAIFLAALIGAVAFGTFHHFCVKPSFRADASIYITNTESVITLSDLQMSAALTEDYAMIIKSRTVLNRVIDELDLNLDFRELRKLITVENPNSTHIITITVTCDDMELSRNIANALMNVGIDQIYQTVGSGEPTIIDASEAAAVEEVTPGILSYMLKGALIGAILVCVVLVIRMLTNTTLQTEEDVEKYLQIPILAAVPYYREKRVTKG